MINRYQNRDFDEDMAEAQGGSILERAARSNAFALVALVVIVAAFVAVAVEAALTPHAQENSNEATSAYNWDYLHEENGRFVYSVEGKPSSTTGVDVSEHQGYIDWAAVKNDGISFAFVRVGARGLTSGNVTQDEYFEYNAKAAAEAGLQVGAYFYSQATTEDEAREEADFVIERLRGRNITFPVAYDHERVRGMEGRADEVSPEQMTKNAEAFCSRIQEAGYTPMIYGSLKDFLRYNLPDLAKYKIWLAQYDTNAPTFNQYFSFWQYTNQGTVKGINGNVDLNIQFLGEQG